MPSPRRLLELEGKIRANTLTEEERAELAELDGADPNGWRQDASVINSFQRPLAEPGPDDPLRAAIAQYRENGTPESAFRGAKQNF